MTGGNVEFTKEDLKQSYEKIFWELNEVQTGLDGKEKIEGLNGILTKTFSDELKKPENNKIKEALEKSFNTVKNNPDLSKRAGEGLQVLGVFFNGLSNEKVGDKAEADYKEFMEKLIKNPESLSRMTREEVARVKFYLQDKSHEKEACDMYKEIRKDVIDANKLQSLKGQDKEFTNEILACLKENYGKSDLFVEAEYKSKMEPKTEQLKKFVNGTWEGKDIEERDLKVVDNGIVDKKYLIKKFSEINKERSENNSKYVLENIKIDQEWLKNVQVSGADFDTALGYLLPNLSVQVMEFGRLGQIQLANEKEVGPILDNLKENIKNKFRVQFDQVVSNSTLDVEDDLLGKINSFAKGNEFIVKNGENVTYHPDKAAAYLKELVGEGIQWSALEKKNKNNGERQAWIAAVQVLLNNDKKLGAPIKVTGEYEAKDGDPTYGRVIVFQGKHPENFGKDRGSGWNVDGKPGQNVINVLVYDQKLIEQAQNKKDDEIVVEYVEAEGNASELPEVTVPSERLKPKNPISFSSENVEMEEGKTGKLEGVGAFDGNGSFEFESSIREEKNQDGNTTVTLGNDVYTGVGYTMGKGLSIQPFTGKGYQRGDSGATKWFFIGEYNEENKTGKGKRVFENGAFYEGEWKDTLENGKGVYTYANGDKYEGEFKDGKEEGSGKYTFKNGNEYVGLFKNDKFEGEGKYTVKEENRNIVLEGIFTDSKFVSGTVTIGRKTHNVTYMDEKLYVTIGNGEKSNQYVDMNTWEVKDLNSEIV